jgi:hypothetical protein
MWRGEARSQDRRGMREIQVALQRASSRVGRSLSCDPFGAPPYALLTRPPMRREWLRFMIEAATRVTLPRELRLAGEA